MAFHFWNRSSNKAIQEAISNTEITSPDYLGHKPRNNHDVIRIGRKPLICVGLSLSVIAGVMTYTLVVKSIAAERVSEDDGKQNDQQTSIIPFLDKKPNSGIIGDDKPFGTVTLSKRNEGSVPLVPALDDRSAGSPNPYQDAELQMWRQREQEKLQLEQAKRAELQRGLIADTTVYSNNQMAASHGPLLHGSVKQQEQGDSSQPQQSNGNAPPAPTDAGNYLSHTRVQPISQFEIKAGTVIPSVMLGGINSDLPGQIMAQVSHNIYDSATGQYLLVPQGSKLVGNYDHQVASGQHRVLIVWQRLIYPDASAVNLENMQGADQGGYAGFKDRLNTHFWPTFRNALMLSAITAGVQLSQPKAQNGSTYSSQQMIAGSMGMQMNNLGMLSISKNMNQAPTIEIRPGYVFNVLINKDMVLSPWQPGAVAYGSND